MNPQRRRWLQTLAACAGSTTVAAAAPAQGVQEGRVLGFPADHGAHPETRTEWWYATGWLGSEAVPSHGFQITFFRSRTGFADDLPGRFAARQLLFAHAAVTDIAGRRHAHDQHLVRWNGQPGSATGNAAMKRGAVQLGSWSLHDEGSLWRALAGGSEMALDLRLQRSQPLLLQGKAGYSRKGPGPRQASHYYSEPQLIASGSVSLAGRSTRGSGRAWLDHEWSDEILAADAVGWDWIGMNLFDGSALTAFVLRRADGSALWAGGSLRRPDAAGTPGTPGKPGAAGTAAAANTSGRARSFSPDELRFTPLARWRSPATGASYPVQWQVDSPAGRHTVRALVDAQELDSRASTGTVYWEGLSELLDTQGRRVGLGYLEMTGYAGALRL